MFFYKMSDDKCIILKELDANEIDSVQHSIDECLVDVVDVVDRRILWPLRRISIDSITNEVEICKRHLMKFATFKIFSLKEYISVTA